jgi:hypothetical protein
MWYSWLWMRRVLWKLKWLLWLVICSCQCSYVTPDPCSLGVVFVLGEWGMWFNPLTAKSFHRTNCLKYLGCWEVNWLLVNVILPRCGPQRKHCLQQVLYCCLLIRCCECVHTAQSPSNADLENTAYSVVASVICCRGNVFIVLLPSNNRLYSFHYSGFRHMSHRHTLWKHKMVWDIGFWQQTLWSLLFSRTPCCLVHCRQSRRLLLIHTNLLPSKRRYQCTRLHWATITYIFVSIGDRRLFAIHFNILQLQLGHLRHKFSWLLLTMTDSWIDV